jgi:hypothetical protein
VTFVKVSIPAFMGMSRPMVRPLNNKLHDEALQQYSKSIFAVRDLILPVLLSLMGLGDRIPEVLESDLLIVHDRSGMSAPTEKTGTFTVTSRLGNCRRFLPPGIVRGPAFCSDETPGNGARSIKFPLPSVIFLHILSPLLI